MLLITPNFCVKNSCSILKNVKQDGMPHRSNYRFLAVKRFSPHYYVKSPWKIADSQNEACHSSQRTSHTSEPSRLSRMNE